MAGEAGLSAAWSDIGSWGQALTLVGPLERREPSSFVKPGPRSDWKCPMGSLLESRRYIKERERQTMAIQNCNLFNIPLFPCQLLKLQLSSFNQNRDQLLQEPIRKQGLFNRITKYLANLLFSLLYISPCLIWQLSWRHWTHQSGHRLLIPELCSQILIWLWEDSPGLDSVEGWGCWGFDSVEGVAVEDFWSQGEYFDIISIIFIKKLKYLFFCLF